MTREDLIGPPETRDQVVRVAQAFASEVTADETMHFAAWTLRRVEGGVAGNLFHHATPSDLMTVGADALRESHAALVERGCGCTACARKRRAIAEALDVLRDVVTWAGIEPVESRH